VSLVSKKFLFPLKARPDGFRQRPDSRLERMLKVHMISHEITSHALAQVRRSVVITHAGIGDENCQPGY
jgi:hypothetical protein